MNFVRLQLAWLALNQNCNLIISTNHVEVGAFKRLQPYIFGGLELKKKTGHYQEKWGNKYPAHNKLKLLQLAKIMHLFQYEVQVLKRANV